MVDVLAAERDPDREKCPHDTTHDHGCGDTHDCPFDTTVDKCPFDTTEPPDKKAPEPRQQADLAVLRQQLHLALAELR
ncbi:MAG: hypothetical protein ACLGI9_12205 [Thermoanaerobaculia bacterium]